MNLVEKRKANIINFVYYTFLVMGYYVFAKYAFWLVAPFIIAFMIAMALQKPVRAISKKTHIKKNIIAAIAVLLILSILVSAVVLVGYRLFVEFKGLGQFVMSKLNDLPSLVRTAENWVLDKLTFLPDTLERTVTDAVSGIVDNLLLMSEDNPKGEQGEMSLGNLDLSLITTPIGGILSTAKHIPVFLSATLISIIACFFVTCDYDGFTGMIKQNVSEEHEKKLVRTKRLLGDILGKWGKSYLTIIFITFCEVSIGLNILKFIGVYDGGYLVAISIVTALVDILPVLGTGTIMIPWAVINFLTGNIGLGIGLLVLYAVITVIRQILEPRLVAMNVGIHPVLTLMGMYLGVQLFGVIGLFLLPITFVLLKALNDEGIIHLWGRDRFKKAENQK